jgi:hypothetical protein
VLLNQGAGTDLTFLGNLTKAQMLANEIKTYTDAAGQVRSGYGRQRLGLVASLSNGTFFLDRGNPYQDGQIVYLTGATFSGLMSGVPYYMVNSTSVSFAVANRPGGPPLAGLSGSGTIVVKPSGAYNPTTNRVEQIEPVRFTAQNNYFVSGLAILKGGVQQSNLWVNLFDDLSKTVTIPTGHNLTTGDEIAFNTSATNGAGLPSGVGRQLSYWVRVLSPTQFTLHTSQTGALTNADQVLFGAKPVGLYDVWMMYLNGEIDFLCSLGAVIQLTSDQNNLIIQVATYLNNWGIQIGR